MYAFCMAINNSSVAASRFVPGRDESQMTFCNECSMDQQTRDDSYTSLIAEKDAYR